MIRKKNLVTLFAALTLFMVALTPAWADGRYNCPTCTCNQYKFFADIDLVNSSGTHAITTLGPYSTFTQAQTAADNYVSMYPEYSSYVYEAEYCSP